MAAAARGAARGVMTPAEEEAIIAKRYLTQTVVSSQNTLPPFKKLAKAFMEFSQALEGGSDDRLAEKHQELLADLYAIQFYMQASKLEAAGDAFRREQQAYAEKQAQLQASIQQARAAAERDIEDRKAELEAARVALAHEREYEGVPARSATRAEMDAVHREIADLQQQGADLDGAMERRRAQFGEVVAAIERVWGQLEHDSVEEGALPAEEEEGKQAAQAPPQPPGGETPAAMQLG
eukprot:scaffold13.g344.t1